MIEPTLGWPQKVFATLLLAACLMVMIWLGSWIFYKPSETERRWREGAIASQKATEHRMAEAERKILQQNDEINEQRKQAEQVHRLQAELDTLKAKPREQRGATEEAERVAAMRPADLPVAAKLDAAKAAAEKAAVEAAAEVAGQPIADYVAAIQSSVRARWRKPLNWPPGMRCELRVKLEPSGKVIAAQERGCGSDPAFANSVRDAVTAASPLRVPTDIRLFNNHFRNFIMDFRAEG